MTRNWSNKLRQAAQGALLLALLAGCKGKSHGPAAGAPGQPVATPAAQLYTCPMHPQIVRDAPGKCPICGMDLVPKASGAPTTASGDMAGANLSHLVTAPNTSVVSGIATVHPTSSAEADTLTLPGVVDYDPRRSRAVAARVGGRIERLLVRFNYQPVRKGQTLLELYSPELVTAEQEYIFLLSNDADNTVLVNGARQKLRLLGLSESQLRALARTRRPDYRVAVLSPYDGYVVENALAAAAPAPPSPAGMAEASAPAGGMGGASAMSSGAESATATAPPSAPIPALTLQEGGYVSTGQTLFQVMNTAQVWGMFQPGPVELAQLRPGQTLQVLVDGDPTHPLTARVELVEPTYRAGASTPAVRVSLPNPKGLLRRGTRLTARLTSAAASGWWLPRAAVVDLGTRQAAFVRRGPTFVPVTVQVGQRTASQVQIRQGLRGTEDVAANGQYLVDSESFLQTTSIPPSPSHD